MMKSTNGLLAALLVACDVTATFRLAEDEAKFAGVAAAFDFSNWSANNYVLIPASVHVVTTL